MLLLLQVQNQLQPKWVVKSLTTSDGGVRDTTLADIMSNQLQPDFEQYKDLFTAQACFCVGLPGQSPWLQTSAGQGLDHHFAGCG